MRRQFLIIVAPPNDNNQFQLLIVSPPSKTTITNYLTTIIVFLQSEITFPFPESNQSFTQNSHLWLTTGKDQTKDNKNYLQCFVSSPTFEASGHQALKSQKSSRGG